MLRMSTALTQAPRTIAEESLALIGMPLFVGFVLVSLHPLPVNTVGCIIIHVYFQSRHQTLMLVLDENTVFPIFKYFTGQ